MALAVGTTLGLRILRDRGLVEVRTGRREFVASLPHTPGWAGSTCGSPTPAAIRRSCSRPAPISRTCSPGWPSTAPGPRTCATWTGALDEMHRATDAAGLPRGQPAPAPGAGPGVATRRTRRRARDLRDVDRRRPRAGGPCRRHRWPPAAQHRCTPGDRVRGTSPRRRGTRRGSATAPPRPRARDDPAHSSAPGTWAVHLGAGW